MEGHEQVIWVIFSHPLHSIHDNNVSLEINPKLFLPKFSIFPPPGILQLSDRPPARIRRGEKGIVNFDSNTAERRLVSLQGQLPTFVADEKSGWSTQTPSGKKMICAFRNPFIKPCSGAMFLELLCKLDGRVCVCDSTVEGDSDRLETVR
jgi:hypothetical protein